MNTLILVGIVLLTSSASAEIYTYTDTAGQKHFVDDLSKIPSRYRPKVKEAKDLPSVSVVERIPPGKGTVTGSVAASKLRRGADQQPETAVTVDLYVTSWCGYCRKMEQFLLSQGIPFRKYDIEEDPAAAEIHRKLGGGGVPVAKIGNNVVRGFNPDAVLTHVGKK